MFSGARPLLAIDSSTELAGLALYDGEQVCELVWHAGRNQTSTFSTQIHHFLALNGVTLQNIGAVAVAIGPGGFSGLRVGLSVAKGLCYSLDLPIIGVETLDAVAYPHVGTRAPIRAFVPAGRKRVVFADYRHRNGRWVRLSELQNERIESLANGIAERTVITGEMSLGLAELLAKNTLVAVPSPALRSRRPSYLAEIGYRRWHDGETDQLETLEPVYVHGSDQTNSVAAKA